MEAFEKLHNDKTKNILNLSGSSALQNKKKSQMNTMKSDEDLLTKKKEMREEKKKYANEYQFFQNERKEKEINLNEKKIEKKKKKKSKINKNSFKKYLFFSEKELNQSRLINDLYNQKYFEEYMDLRKKSNTEFLEKFQNINDNKVRPKK